MLCPQARHGAGSQSMLRGETLMKGRQSGVTLVGFARESQQVVYAHPDRLV